VLYRLFDRQVCGGVDYQAFSGEAQVSTYKSVFSSSVYTVLNAAEKNSFKNTRVELYQILRQTG
jgi:hypothetical protein